MKYAVTVMEFQTAGLIPFHTEWTVEVEAASAEKAVELASPRPDDTSVSRYTFVVKELK